MLQLSTCWINPALLLAPHCSPFLWLLFSPLLIFGTYAALAARPRLESSWPRPGSPWSHSVLQKSFFGFETPVRWSIIRVERSLELLVNFGPACGREYYVHVLDVFTRRLSRVLQPDTPGGTFPAPYDLPRASIWGKGSWKVPAEGKQTLEGVGMSRILRWTDIADLRG